MSCESETDDYEGKDSIADCDQVPYIYADVMPQGHVGQGCHCERERRLLQIASLGKAETCSPLIRFQVTFLSLFPPNHLISCLPALLSLLSFIFPHCLSPIFLLTSEKPSKIVSVHPSPSIECLQTNIHRLSSENVCLWPSNSRSASHLRRDHFHAQQ